MFVTVAKKITVSVIGKMYRLSMQRIVITAVVQYTCSVGLLTAQSQVQPLAAMVVV